MREVIQRDPVSQEINLLGSKIERKKRELDGLYEERSRLLLMNTEEGKNLSSLLKDVNQRISDLEGEISRYQSEISKLES